MNAPTQTSSIDGKPPGIWGTLSVGVLLGVVATLLGGCLMTAAMLLRVFSAPPSPYMRPLSAEDFAGPKLVGYSLLALGFSSFGIVPGIAGGAVVALVQQKLARQGPPTTRAGVTAGLLVGFGAGTALTLFLLVAIPAEGHRTITGGRLETTVFTIGIATLAGMLHGWLLGGWLRRRMT